MGRLHLQETFCKWEDKELVRGEKKEEIPWVMPEMGSLLIEMGTCADPFHAAPRTIETWIILEHKKGEEDENS